MDYLIENSGLAYCDGHIRLSRAYSLWDAIGQ
jgi:hypothetical protein